MDNGSAWNELIANIECKKRLKDDASFVEGYKYAANKAIKWLNQKMYSLMVDMDGTIREEFRKEMLKEL